MEHEGGIPWNTHRTSTSPPFERRSKRRKGFPSETHVKAGLRFVHAKRISSRSSAETTSAPVAPAVGFKNCCLRTGKYDGEQRNHFFQGAEQPKCGPRRPLARPSVSHRTSLGPPPPSRIRHLGSLGVFRPSGLRGRSLDLSRLHGINPTRSCESWPTSKWPSLGSKGSRESGHAGK